MLRGEVEPTYTPHNPLDVLAQQVVAMVAVEDWDVDALYRLVRQAYAYRDLSYQAFHAVLEMLAGRYHDAAQRELAARLAWDRVNNRLMALPGSRNLAVTNGGTIPDRGAFGAYLTDGKTKLGELDEEFVFETRIGDVFMLGSQVWRVVEITPDRMVVAPAPGETARMPFWHGDYPWRPYELGREVGEFRRKAAAKLRAEVPEGQSFRAILEKRGEGETPAMIEWLRTDYALDDNSAWNVVDYVAGQLDNTGAISSDRADRRRGVRKRAGRAAHGHSVAFWRAGERTMGSGPGRARCASGPASTWRCRAATTASCCASPTQAARSPRASWPRWAPRGAGAHSARNGRFGAVRRPIPPERGPRAAAARQPPGQADAFLAAAAEGPRPASGRSALSRTSRS